MSSLLSLQSGCFKRALLCRWPPPVGTAPHGWAVVGNDHSAKDTRLLHLVDRKEPGTESLERKKSQGETKATTPTSLVRDWVTTYAGETRRGGAVPMAGG